MKIRCYFSAPGRDVPVTDDDRQRPFLIAPDTPHPSLVLGDYLDAVTAFLLNNDSHNLLKGLKGVGAPSTTLDEGDELIIRTEKHGALYHIASVSCRRYQEKETVRLAVTTAITPANRERLPREFSLLQNLYAKVPESLPKVFVIAEQHVAKGDCEGESFVIMLGQWLEDYHEWHLSRDGKGKERVRLWDYCRGYRFLEQEEETVLIRTAATILARLYDLDSGSQVHPWHHAAGDFVATGDKSHGLAVRLITVRGYGPLLEYPPEAGPLPPLFSFFLHTTLRLRMDRLDGTGRPAWFGDHVLPAIIAGFFDGLGRRLGDSAELLEILRQFSAEELQEVCGPLLDIYHQENEEDGTIINENLPAHCRSLRHALQEFSPETMN